MKETEDRLEMVRSGVCQAKPGKVPALWESHQLAQFGAPQQVTSILLDYWTNMLLYYYYCAPYYDTAAISHPHTPYTTHPHPGHTPSTT